MLKKVLLSLLCLCFLANGLPLHTKATDVVTSEYLESWKRTIGETAYFVYTPQSEEELLNLGEDEIIAVFEGLKVTKKLLNENLELDIDKITVNDFIIDEIPLISDIITGPIDISGISPCELVLPDIGGGSYNGTYTLPSIANGVIVTRTNSFSDGTNSAEIVHYLNNADFKTFKNRLSSAQSWGNTWQSILGVLMTVVPPYITVTIGFITAVGALLEDSFINKVNDLYNSGSNIKAKITISGSYKSIVQWTDNKFYARNETVNGSVFKSKVDFLQ